jgi:hypothetical protein
MRPLHHHILQSELSSLRPTQCSIGYQEVIAKREEWRALSGKKREALIQQHWFPTIIGPKHQHFIIDHHHLGVALYEEGQDRVLLTILKDLSWLDESTFWRVMEFHQWAHPFDQNGNRVDHKKIPKSIAQLKDDPYRSLAGLARKQGAFAKDVTPYSEFLWADYFRAHVDPNLIKHSISKALKEAMKVAKKSHASYLPGWTGESA